jgi:amino acid adenylation domain-containing protein
MEKLPMTDAASTDAPQERIPFNSFQKELWLACQTSLSDFSETSTRGIFRVANNISPEILREAIGVVLGHMPLLGATLRLDGNEPCFEFGAPRDIDLRCLDLRDDADRETSVRRFAASFLDEPVDEQFVRYAVLRTGESECVFLFKCSHLALDGLGYFFHVAFLIEVYTALRHGERPDLGEPISLREQYEEDEAYRTSARAEKDMAFWMRHLERLPERRIFRALPGRPDVLGDSRHKRHVLSEAASREIREIMEARGIGPAAYFTALHALIVAYMCDEKDIIIQTPIAFGERKSIKRRQGVRMATPSLFLEMRDYETLEQLLKASARQSADFFRHVRTPFQLAMRKLPDKRLHNIADTFINYLPGRPMGTPDFPIVWIDQDHSEKEPVLLGALVMEDCLTQQYVLLVRSSRNHLSEQDADRYVRRIEHLTHQLAAGVELPQLDYLLDEEKREMERWERGAARPYPTVSLPALFDTRAQDFAQREAVRDERGAALNYAQLRENSLRCAAWLAARGVRRGDVVAVLARRTLHLPEIILGILRCGAVYLPVDPKAPAERNEYILADAGAALTLDAAAPAHADAPPAEPPAGPAPGDAAYLIYTSGSTGRPKGVLAPHGGFVNMIQGQIETFGVGPQDRVLQFAPPVFDASLSEIFMALLAGAGLRPVGDELRNAPWDLRRYMADNGVTVATFPPSYLRLFDKEPFPGLRVLITAGEPPVSADALHYAAGLRYFNAYGPTETCVCASMKRVAPDDSLPISSGRPIPNGVARILDAQGRPRPAGMVGELWVGGASVALGYHGNAELTRRRFRPLPGLGDGPAYATGDLALWTAAGEILLVGRADDQVKIRGNRVELGEVTFLLETCPDVRQAAVLVVQDASGQPALAAFLLLRPGAELEAVAAWSRANLPAYMTPTSWRVLESMLVTRTGKIDRAALARLARAPERAQAEERALAPRLREACERVLGHPCAPETNFFDQGGNSLLAMSLLHELRASFGADVAFRDFAACGDLFDIEALLHKHGPQAAQGPCDAAPLSRGQFRIWAYQQANAGSIDYNMPLLLEARGKAAERFLEALREAVDGQELLACTVAGDIDAPHFVKSEGAGVPVPRAEFADAASAMDYFDDLIHTPFDLRRERPVRLAAARLPNRLQILVLLHHIVGDGETLDILLRNALERLRGGRPPKGALTAQAEFCRREQAHLVSAAFHADAEYWRKTLNPPLPPISSSHERTGAMTSLILPPEIPAGLDRLAKSSGATTPACFAALLARFLCRKYGRGEMLLGLPVGLRETQEEFRTAGFFVNTVALRLSATADITEAAGQLREALAHSRYIPDGTVLDFLATHAHVAPLAGGDLALRRLAPRLRASKFTGSFLLLTGADPRIVLEYDAAFITDGEGLLRELLRDMAETLPTDAAARRDPRSVLTEAWTEILRIDAAECGDFFRAGGDSIKAIQLTGALHRNGVASLSAPDFLRTPRFADLCARLEAAEAQRSEAIPAPARPQAGRRAPLLPIQKALLDGHPGHWKVFNMILPLRLGPDVATATVEAWLRSLPERYESLGLAFTPQGAVTLEQPQDVELLRRDFPPDTPPADALRSLACDFAARLAPEVGRTLAAGLATRGEDRVLVLVGHHLAFDAVSLDILRRDLLDFRRGAAGGDMGRGLATRALEAQQIVDAGRFPAPEQERFWESVLRTPAAPLAALREDGETGPGTAQTRVEGFRQEFSPSVPADLLAALAVALHGLGQRDTVFVSLESHGRDALLPDLDLSRSLGWFTAVCPMPLAPAATCAEAETAVRPFVLESFTPLNANAYGYLRARDPERFGVRAQIGFNYLGAAPGDADGDVVPLLSLTTPGAIPELLHPEFRPDCPLDLAAWFDASGALHLLAYFNRGALPESWASGLLEAWAGALRTLPAYRRPLPEETLAAIRATCACAAGDIERIAEPWPSQEPLLYQRLAADDGVYTQQITFRFGGDLDGLLLLRAWATVVDRHESLRTLFPMPCPGEFHRAVLRRARAGAEYHDLAHLPPEAARAEAEALLRAQRAKGFDLDRGPLLRAQFFRLDDGTLALSWCFHHLLMDGWCIGVLLEELFTVYAGLAGQPARPLPPPFALTDYERWRARFDAVAARAYWAELLDGFTQRTGVADPAAPRGGGDPETAELSLDAGLSDGLRAAATGHAVTLSVLMQALWSLVLGAANGGRRDVVFGVVTSGRPAELDGVDRAVGLFIQTLPLRARWTGTDGLGALLAGLKEQGLQQMRHGYLPLAEIGGRLLDHLMVFENYPAASPFREDGPRLLEIRGHEKIPYPLGITIIPGERLGLRFLYDPAVLEPARVAGLMDRLNAVLRAAAARPDSSCRELEEVIAAVPALPATPAHPTHPTHPVRVAAPLPAAPGGDAALEDAIREIYAEVLGRPVPSADADFHLLGGHSLSAMRVLAQLAKQLGVRVAVNDILNQPTPRKLAARIRSAAAPAADIPRAPSGGTHPLSTAQRRIWFLQRLHEDSRTYQIPIAARLRGPLDDDALQRALLLLETRHGALRLRVSDEKPEQRLAPPGGLRLEIHAGPCPELARGVAPMPFGFDRPLVRAALYREAEDDCVLFFSAHHILFDGWSAEVFFHDLNQAYAAALRGTAPDWPPQELDYLSYAAWERVQEPAGLAAVRDDLSPLPERLRLPLDFPRPARRSFAGGVRVFRLAPEQGRRLKAYARDAGVTLFPVLVALVAAFLRRHTGQDDMLLGCPTANRELPQTQNMIGLFANTLVLRTRIDPDQGFAVLVRTADAALGRALAAQSCPFEKLLDAVGVERDPSRNPLFDVFVALEDAAWTDHNREPLRLEPLPLPHDRSKFDLSVYFREPEPDAYEVHLEYSAELFSGATIQAMCARLATLIDAVLRREDVPLHALDILPGEELERLRGFNATAEPLGIERDMDSLFAAQARKTPGGVAVLDRSGRPLSYAEFDARVSALAGYLAAQGLGRGDFVAVCRDRSPELLVCVFAVLRLGAVYVPLSANLPEARLRAVFEDLGRCAVLCAPDRAALFTACGQRALTPAPCAPPPGSAGTAGRDRAAPDDLAYVIFTSGSTGRPKGVQIEHRSVCNRILWMQSRFPIGPGDVVLQKTTVTFDVSVWELFWWSWCGAALALLEPEAEGDPARIAAAVQARRVTVIHFVPSMLRVFLDHLEARPEEVRKLASLRYVFTSGEALPRELVARFNALLGDAQLHNLYGPTEATVDVTWQPCPETPPRAVPIGRPISNTALHVLDARRHPTPIGVAGEIWISGVQVARGYVNRPELTAQSFVPDPDVPGGRMYRSGDLGRWLPEGSIEYLGRNDDQVKVRGHRIELGEVEAALSRCAGVAQAVVRTCRIGGHDALEAFLLPRENAAPSLRGLRAELAALLPEYMRPALFHTVAEIPLTSSGKADRKRLKGAPLLPGAAGYAGGTALQDEVRALWRRVMPEVDVRDADLGFFEAGGNSLLLVQLHALLEERWPGVFSLAGLFSESTVRAQARFIEQARGEARPQDAAAAADEPVAIIGMAVRIGDYEDAERFWADLAAGADKNVPLPETRRREVRQIFEAVGFPFDAARLREAAYLADVSAFDCKRFGLSPGDASLLDPTQRVFLETALQALDDAGYGGAALENAEAGVFAGASPYRLFQDAATRAFPDQAEQIYLLNVPSNVTARLSHLKNWRGPAALIDTACSSVLTAVHEACASLRRGECSVALAGGAHLIDMPVKAGRTFTIESASGLTRTFDADADGVGAGEGAAVFVLKPLPQALRDHDAIHAVILGSAVNQDGRSSSMAAPNPAAQAAVIARAARNARVSLADVSFFEAHGTATALGDPVEIEGLRRAFELDGATPRRKALIGSVKGNLGHLDAAAGAVGLAKAVLCLEKGAVPPQPHFRRPNPHIDFDAAPVRVARTLTPLPQAERPWRCGVSAFGLSGVNTHVILAEHAAAPLPADDGAWFCVPLSARDGAGLRECRRRLREALVRDERLPLHAVAATLTTGREHLEARTAIVAQTRQELLDALADDAAPADGGRQERGDAGEPAASAVCATREAAEAAAAVFLRGGTLRWPEDRPLHRAHLPATPLRRATLWPRFAERFLSGPVRTPAGEAYEIAIDRPEFWPVAEHRLNGAPTLVGMAMLDLVARAAGPAPLRIANLRWRRPLTFAPGGRAVLLVEERDGGRFVTLQHFDGAQWSLAAEAEVRPPVPAQPAALDLAALRRDLRPVAAEDGGGPVRVSGRWDCREALLASKDGDRLLADIALPDEYRSDLNTFRWHPAMADVAASLALRGAAGYVPAGCGEARLHRPLPARIQAHVAVTDRRPGRITARCVITDRSGGVLAELLDLTFLALAQGRTAADSAAGPQPALYAEDWTPCAPPAGQAVPDDAVMILGPCGGALGEALAARFRLRRELPQTPAGRQVLAEEILRAGVRQIVHLPAPGDDAWAFPGQLQELCRVRLRSPLRITAVADGGLRAAGSTPEQALILGPLLCLPQEEPLLSCAYVELASPEPEALRALLDGLGRFDGACVVDADGTARTRRLKPLDAPRAAFPALDPEACVVISGGLGGMGLTLARQIDAVGDRVVLLHRRAETPPDLPCAAYRCDVTDSGQVAAVLAAVRREVGPIQGVIHAAGVAGEGYLLSKTAAAYATVLAPKVAGTWNLHEATRNDALRFFVLASSRTALPGAPGQCDYTAANAFLNAFARFRRAQGLPAVALGWNAWSGVGMAARRGADRLGPALAPEQAFGVLQAALGADDAAPVVAMPGEDLGPRPSAAAPGPETPRQAASAESLEAELLEIIRDCLGYETAPTRADDFFELGGDSIAGTRIVGRAGQELGLAVSVMDLLESDTLGDFLDRALAGRALAADEGRSLEPAPVRDKYPVGHEQLSIIYADLLGGERLAFNLPAFLTLPRDLDKGRLEAAIAALVRRHDVLRTSFCDFDAERPNMIIHPYAGFTLEEVRIPDLAHKDAQITPFDIRREIGFRAKLLLPDDGAPVLYYDVHHALADGRTISLLNAELFRLYHGLPLEPVSAQMKDIAWRQVTHADERDREFWRALFADGLPLLDLPADHPRPEVFTYRGGMYEFELPAPLVADVKALARREGVTSYHVVLAAWSLLLHAYTGDRSFVLAVSVDSRGEHLNTAGMLASLLPLRLAVDDAKPLGALLRDTRTASNEALRHGGYILHELLADLRPPARLDRSPLSEVILSYMNYEFATGEPQMFEPLRFDKRVSKTDLSIFASDTGGRIGFALEYYADLFSRANVVAMAEDFLDILTRMAAGRADDPVDLAHARAARRPLGAVSRRLGGDVVRDLRRLAARKGVGTAAVLLATFAALLNRVAARRDFVVDVADRGPVRFAIDDGMEFDDLLARTEAALTAAPGGPDRDAPDGAGLRVAFAWNAEAALDAGHDLLCAARDGDDAIDVRFVHDTRPLAAETAATWLDYYARFLAGVLKEDA